MVSKGIIFLSIGHTYMDILRRILEHLINDDAPTDPFMLGLEIVFVLICLLVTIYLIRCIINLIRNK